MKKRLFSLAVAICMIAAMIPVVAAVAPALEEGESISYYFGSHATTTGISKLNDAATADYDADLGRYWRFKQASDNNAAKSQLKLNRINGDTRGVNKYIALELSVPEDGIYKAEYIYYKIYSNGSYGSQGDVYIIPEGTSLADLATAKKAGTKIASVDYSPVNSDDAGVAKDPVVYEGLELKKGDNIILFIVTGKGANASIGGNTDYYTTPCSLTLTLTEKASAADKELTDAFTPDETVDVTDSYVAPSVGGLTTGGAINPIANGDGTYEITAPETKNGAKFLYWAKGLTTNKKIISFSNVIENYVPEEDGRNLLIAVYEDEVSGNAEYYNANGQLIPGATQETKVTMAGYGTSNGWDSYGDTNIYVAHYDLEEPEKNINIAVTGGSGTGIYAYGDTVTCTADSTENFKCWKKNGEIVSCDTTYTFKAWEGCTIEALNEEATYNGSTMKIVIDDFSVGADIGVMAEFIGFAGDVVEKGIMFTATGETEAKKIAMTKPGTQFSIIADARGKYEGYAILKNENNYTLITDGSFTK
ncbi:MAG: hypothetical protein IJF32_13405 [Oscillospiraceae bacterium]|nr:hypothetical protein [Oscillospiraceae bacterium]MBQ7119017.1 hypothetical protein [Oscillospiraceae bacterium]